MLFLWSHTVYRILNTCTGVYKWSNFCYTQKIKTNWPASSTDTWLKLSTPKPHIHFQSSRIAAFISCAVTPGSRWTCAGWPWRCSGRTADRSCTSLCLPFGSVSRNDKELVWVCVFGARVYTCHAAQEIKSVTEFCYRWSDYIMKVFLQ